MRQRLSIGMPVYNAEDFVAGSIESILGQTFQDYELIISDNGSSDGTETICRRYAAHEHRIRYERQDQNRGAAWNYDRVFALSRGEFFKWATHDDLHATEFLAKCIDALNQDSGILWCHSRFTHVGPDGRPLADPRLSNVGYSAAAGNVDATREASDPCRRFRAVLLGVGGCVDLYGVVRRSVLAKTMLYLPYYGAEKVLIGELALRGRYCEVPETLFFLRVHPEGSGNLATAAEQARFMNPGASSRRTFTRWRLLGGHIRAVARAPLTRRQRIRCFGVIMEYLMQVRKWHTVLLRTMRGQGTGGGYIEHASDSAREDAVSNHSTGA